MVLGPGVPDPPAIVSRSMLRSRHILATSNRCAAKRCSVGCITSIRWLLHERHAVFAEHKMNFGSLQSTRIAGGTMRTASNSVIQANRWKGIDPTD